MSLHDLLTLRRLASTPAQRQKSDIDLREYIISNLQERYLNWQGKKGFSDRMDRWCDWNIKEINKQIEIQKNKIEIIKEFGVD